MTEVNPGNQEQVVPLTDEAQIATHGVAQAVETQPTFVMPAPREKVTVDTYTDTSAAVDGRQYGTTPRLPAFQTKW